MKMCRQGSNNLPFSANLFYQSEETHFNKSTINYNRIINRYKKKMTFKKIISSFLTLNVTTVPYSALALRPTQPYRI